MNRKNTELIAFENTLSTVSIIITLLNYRSFLIRAVRNTAHAHHPFHFHHPVECTSQPTSIFIPTGARALVDCCSISRK